MKNQTVLNEAQSQHHLMSVAVEELDSWRWAWRVVCWREAMCSTVIHNCMQNICIWGNSTNKTVKGPASKCSWFLLHVRCKKSRWVSKWAVKLFPFFAPHHPFVCVRERVTFAYPTLLSLSWPHLNFSKYKVHCTRSESEMKKGKGSFIAIMHFVKEQNKTSAAASGRPDLYVWRVYQWCVQSRRCVLLSHAYGWVGPILLQHSGSVSLNHRVTLV